MSRLRLIGPGVAVECPCHDGMHINADHILVELIDSDSGEKLPLDAEGELVLTSLTRETALLKVQGLAPQYLIFVDRSTAPLDSLELWVEASPDLCGQGEFGVNETEQKANRELYEMLGMHSSVLVVEPRKLERSLGKALRVMDKRNVKA